MAEFALLPRHLSGKLEKNHKKNLFKIVGLPNEIRISWIQFGNITTSAKFLDVI
jgi:hypothetical protein